MSALLATPTPERRHRHLIRASIIGLGAGLVAVAFHHLLIGAEDSRTRLLARLHEHGGFLAFCVLPLVSGLAGAFVGWITQRFSPDAAGSGIPHLKGVLFHLRQMKWRSLLLVKFLAGLVGIGAGLSLGREGPTVQMGSAVGAMVADGFDASPRSRLPLVSCGAGAGLAAAFNAPLAGFLFVIEELHRELSPLTFGGAFVAAVSADILVRLLGDERSAFAHFHEIGMPVSLLPAIVLLGVVTGLIGLAFNRSLVFCAERVRSQQRVPAWTMPAIVGALAGVVAWWMPEAVGSGQSVAGSLLAGSLEWTFGGLFLLLVAKFALTLASYASGAPGGIFAPMLLLGATVGVLVAKLTAFCFPIAGDSAASFAVLGMAAFFCASVRAPLTGIVLIVEMTGSYEHLLDICLVSLCAYLVVESFHDRPIYDALLHADLHRRGLLPAHLKGSEPRSLLFVIESASPLDGVLLKDAGLPLGCLVTGIARGGRALLPNASLKITAGDQLTVLLTVTQESVLKLRALTRSADSGDEL